MTVSTIFLSRLPKRKLDTSQRRYSLMIIPRSSGEFLHPFWGEVDTFLLPQNQMKKAPMNPSVKSEAFLQECTITSHFPDTNPQRLPSILEDRTENYKRACPVSCSFSDRRETAPCPLETSKGSTLAGIADNDLAGREK